MGNSPFKRKTSTAPRNVYESVIYGGTHSPSDHFVYINQTDMNKFRESGAGTSVSSTISSGTGMYFNILSVPSSVESVTPSTLRKVECVDEVPETYVRRYEGYCARVVTDDGITSVTGTLHERCEDGTYEYVFVCDGCAYHTRQRSTSSQDKLYTPSPGALQRVKLSSFSSSNVSASTSGGIPLQSNQVTDVMIGNE